MTGQHRRWLLAPGGAAIVVLLSSSLGGAALAGPLRSSAHYVVERAHIFDSTSSRTSADHQYRDPSRPPPASMEDIYGALTLGNLRTESGAASFPAGSPVRFVFDFVSHSRKPLVVPFNPGFGFYVLGVEQTWVVRLGSDHSLPLPPIISRKGDWYATGGQIIVATDLARHHRLVYGATFPRGSELTTAGFPAGVYRYFVEYKPVYGGLDDVLQTVQIDFTLTE